MKKRMIVIIIGFVFLGVNIYANPVYWGYTGEEGPEYWGELSADYEMCSKGKNQSPINITGAIECELQPISFSYKRSTLDVINNGHTIKANYDVGSFIKVDGDTYNLIQIHWHTPSENTIEGKSFPMEAHFVHADKNGNLAVIGIMYTKGNKNSAISGVWDNMPSKRNATSKDSRVTISAMNMLPADKDYYYFNGSLTTPPCSEGVRWMVMKNPVEASIEQINKFHSTFHGDTNRPVQPINARPILK
ncbi:MAG: carbonic anhydrase family protein [Thermodesulfobacteriota bacterium]|nr:carbonic anhydrase family protein [Thermodesulfobacteriota bacterium]